MALPHPIHEDLAELVARRFRVLAEPMRIRLLDRLRDGEATVGELAEALAASQQNVSKHLAVLARRRHRRSRARTATASTTAIADESVFALCEQVCGALQQQLASSSCIEVVDRR